MQRLKSRDGFALPMALLVMIVLTAGIAAGFSATSAEVVTNAAHRSDNRAYNLAEAGLEQYLATRKDTLCTAARSGGSSTAGTVITTSCMLDPALATADSEWVRLTLAGGYAEIKSVLVRKYIDNNQPAIFFIRSTGVDKTIKLTGATSGDSAMRTVGMYAGWTKSVVEVQGAWFALSGLHKNGNAGNIDGHDQCTTAQGGGRPDVAGAVVPSGGAFSGDVSPFSGSPAIDTTKTFAQIKASVKLDWAGIIGGSIAWDFEVPQQAFPNATWFTSHPTSWPVIRVHSQDYSLPNAGRGMIIADSNFVISGSDMWDGIVLIGGKLTSNGNNTTAGATLAGLNFLLPGAGNPTSCVTTTKTCSSDDSDANGQKTYVYNSCNVDKAAAGLRSYKPMNNTWLDNIPIW